MSTINGSCSESASKLLFEQGIEKQQLQKQQDEQRIAEQLQKPPAAEPVAEGLKGHLFDGFA